MNVYQKTYKEEFIKELPVNFNKIKNMDLTSIPEHFRALFTTDWNWGIHSKMRMEDRMFLQDLFHDYNRWNVQEKLNKLKPVKEEVVRGFIDVD
jgi:hypothetical protein